MRVVALLVAAGRGERLGRSIPKAFVELAGRPLLAHAAEAALACPAIDGVVVAAPEHMEDEVRAVVAEGLVAVVTGGETRQRSVLSALRAVPEGVEAVVCHDVARPLAAPFLFSLVLESLGSADGVVPVVPVPDTIKVVDGGMVTATVDRERLGLAQTPQAFRRAALEEAHHAAEREGFQGTDDAALLERAGFTVAVVPGDPTNLKITTAGDLVVAEATLRARSLAEPRDG
ncbi:MAG TPA: 2-C-methyl-D-erythritol 4-phosphate cytidylyltransferase [Actinomycetota bacterium]